MSLSLTRTRTRTLALTLALALTLTLSLTLLQLIAGTAITAHVSSLTSWVGIVLVLASICAYSFFSHAYKQARPHSHPPHLHPHRNGFLSHANTQMGAAGGEGASLVKGKV